MAASPSPSSDDQFAVGSVLDDRYRIEAVLGTGGMGRVYRAEHTKIGKPVAIKVLHADLTRNREASQRFQREVIAMGRLDHPNIVGVSDFGVLDTGACYMVMEVLQGESLGDRLARDHRLHWVEALDIMRGMLYGLRHAHERGVVHRDIKPDNVYLAHKDGAPVIKILDFGIAKLYAGSEEDPASTRAGLTVGTPAYLSPEQAVGGEITPASDLYSASIVLYEMLSGRAPFEDKDPLAMLGAHVSRPPPRFADVVPGVDIPAPLEDIIQRGLRKPAAERIATANDYLALIDAFSPPLHGFPRLATAPPLDLGAEPSGPVAAAPTAPVTVHGADTPPSGALGAPAPHPSVELAHLPPATRAVSLADVTEPIPLSWIVRSGVVIGLVIIGAIALAIGAHCRGSDAGSRPESSAASASDQGATRDPRGASAPAARPEPDPRPESGSEPAGKSESTGKPEPDGKPEAAKSTALAPRPAAPSKPAAAPKGKPGPGSGSAKKPPGHDR